MVNVNAPVVLFTTIHSPEFGTTKVALLANVPLAMRIMQLYCAALSVVDPPVVGTVTVADVNASTYCFVAACSAAAGSAGSVTVPVNVGEASGARLVSVG
jgi:hypothetical protein